MNTIFIILLVIACGFVLFSLVKGIIAFLQTTKLDLEANDDSRVKMMQMRQNQAMFSRIKWQAAAVAVVAVLLMLNS
ncbi:hypothetical protein QQS45_04105 [Alteriqipengyuania flavescens]|uniref:hypothetical protein n=1 Tax=Alteriqipengyuania flavescens TaxID=3053610 RepID=UPI0025B45FD1|nr:hypothetical protein [Alteriqipengyuania flavescens]WJY19421.1 hypothetical protein QQW98_04100 [Alteriqipengyuania flavescens]WJY25363.1 hypothetical protein QQS45_04105 [Alteriqipengyuania flavescens]